MIAQDIIRLAENAGVTLTARGGELKAKGLRQAVNDLVPLLKQHKPELMELLTTRSTVETRTAACDMAVPNANILDFAAEARRRGLIVRYRIEGVSTKSTVMPRPGQTAEQLRDALRAEFGGRLHLDTEGAT